MSFGGVNRVSPQTPQVQAPQTTAAPAQAKPVQAAPKADSKQFAQTQNQIKLPTTNVNALTQLPSQDQQQILKLAQDTQMNRFVQNMSNAHKQIQADVPPRSLLGAGQSIPPAPMRAAAAALAGGALGLGGFRSLYHALVRHGHGAIATFLSSVALEAESSAAEVDRNPAR